VGTREARAVSKKKHKKRFQVQITLEAAEELVELWLGWDGSLHKSRKRAVQLGRKEASERAEALPHRFYMVKLVEAQGFDNPMATLLRYVPKDQHEAFKNYVGEAIAAARGDIDWDFLGFIDDYEHIGSLVRARTHEKTSFTREHKYTIYDVGCANAWQHVFFPMAKRYVGIDPLLPTPEPRFFVGDCEFVLGTLPEVADLLEVDRDNSIGIANMSLAYTGRPGDFETFDRLFMRKIVL